MKWEEENRSDDCHRKVYGRKKQDEGPLQQRSPVHHWTFLRNTFALPEILRRRTFEEFDDKLVVHLLGDAKQTVFGYRDKSMALTKKRIASRDRERGPLRLASNVDSMAEMMESFQKRFYGTVAKPRDVRLRRNRLMFSLSRIGR